MILRKLADAIREQNWFTVIIEILIVVIGIFLGLQVDDWNKARIDDALSQEYLMRLHGELEDLQANSPELTTIQDVTEVEHELSLYERLKEIDKYLAGNENAPSPDARHCRALYRSHIYSFDILSVPTLEQMLSTGRILLIKDDDLRNELIRFSYSRETAGANLRNITSDRLVLSRTHSDLIKLRADDIGTNSAVCDFEGMRTSQAFINDFSDNLSRYRAYAGTVVQAQQKAVADLHDSVDKALKIDHGEEAP